MKRSTISREAGSTTFDFLAKKTEEEMYHILTMIESGQLYIKDANAFTRSHREKRGPQNDDDLSEVEYLYLFYIDCLGHFSITTFNLVT